MTSRSLLVAAVVLVAVASATAHSALDRAEPRPGSRLRTSPPEVKVWFTERLEPAFSTLRVENGAGQRVDRADGHVDGADRTLIRAGLTPLSPGAYRVVWRVLSVDSHVTEGGFTFRIER
jgi:methionine-rich copper-binding protein CopC